MSNSKPVTIELRGDLQQFVLDKIAQDEGIDLNEQGDFLNTHEARQKIFSYVREFFASRPEVTHLN